MKYLKIRGEKSKSERQREEVGTQMKRVEVPVVIGRRQWPERN